MGFSINNIGRYFDLQASSRTTTPEAHKGGGPNLPVIPQYIALVLGIIVEPFLNHYIAFGEWSVDVSRALGRVIFGLILGIMIFPAVYKRTFDPGKPLFVQFCTVFAAGIGWQSLVQGSGQASGIGG
jgi:hypothetical protein